MDNMKYIIITTVILSFIVSACGSSSDTTKESCLNDSMKGMILRWGGHNYKTNYISGYQIDNKADLYKFEMKNSFEDAKTEKIGNVDEERFCRLLKDTKRFFIEIQALHAPGDTSNFIEFINPVTNTNLRAVWNARYKTYGSREFRALFDSLNLFLEKPANVIRKKDEYPSNTVK
jgi:hypothetical protein